MAKVTEYDLYIPTRDGHGKKVPAARLKALRRELVDYFGGITDTRHRNRGLWKAGGVVIQDDIVIWRILSFRGAKGERFMQQFKRLLEVSLKQQEILTIRRIVSRL